jgi:hypothetical protein
MNALSGDAAQRANNASASASAVCSPLRSASAALPAPSSNNTGIRSPSSVITELPLVAAHLTGRMRQNEWDPLEI